MATPWSSAVTLTYVLMSQPSMPPRASGVSPPASRGALDDADRSPGTKPAPRGGDRRRRRGGRWCGSTVIGSWIESLPSRGPSGVRSPGSGDGQRRLPSSSSSRPGSGRRRRWAVADGHGRRPSRAPATRRRTAQEPPAGPLACARRCGRRARRAPGAELGAVARRRRRRRRPRPRGAGRLVDRARSARSVIVVEGRSSGRLLVGEAAGQRGAALWRWALAVPSAQPRASAISAMLRSSR